MAKRRQAGQAGAGTCPGEAGCKDFKRAAGKTAEEKRHACKMCPLLPTKPIQISAGGFEDFAGHVERLWQERRSGRQLTPDRLTPLEWEGLLVFDACEESYELAHQARVAQMFELLTQFIVSRQS